jgi:serine phosphatase RsbU (regulator of sigma subunit)
MPRPPRPRHQRRPLEVLPDNTFAAASPFTLEPGDMVLLLTDGIMEAHGSDQALFGAQRALDVIQAQRSRPAAKSSRPFTARSAISVGRA